MSIPNPSFPIVECYHCGDQCRKEVIRFDDRSFCCDGCKTVYELLKSNDLCNYYNAEQFVGISPKLKNYQGKFAFLDDAGVTNKLLQFNDGTNAIVVFDLPQMHCSSCVWLLEHLYKLNAGVTGSRTNFLEKTITIQYKTAETSLRKIVELLATLGYEPLLNLENLERKRSVNPLRKRVYRIAVSGFCFANIMMLSFPEYFHIASQGDEALQAVFSYLNLFLALPVLLYGGSEFFVSAYKGMRAKVLNIDVGLSLSIAITFGRSLYEILSGTGAGYLDSMSGIIFFMLVGRYFQEKTHHALQFDRNYKSFFPISVSTLNENGEEYSVPLTAVKVGQILNIRSQELIPADCRCLSDRAEIDYSFVTGESKPVKVLKGELIYAGGKQTGGMIRCEVLREVSQSYLTDLWNNSVFQKQTDDSDSFVQKLAAYFTIFLLILSFGALMYWYPTDSQRGLNALTTVLIVACPCALLLSATFTNGAMIRIFGKLKVYLKNASVLESLAATTDIVMDKTGTITDKVESISYHGSGLSEEQLSMIASLASQSNHPLSRALSLNFSQNIKYEVFDFREITGNGITGIIAGHEVRLGSSSFTGKQEVQPSNANSVHVQIDGQYIGYFSFVKKYRPHLKEVASTLRKKYSLTILSGDNDRERSVLQEMLGTDVKMNFSQTPEDKLKFIESMNQQGAKVLMVGDGLNDAGALKVSHTGIAVSDDVNNFSPACDVIMEGSSFSKLPEIIKLAVRTQNIIKASFVLSLCYNVVGLSFAVQGTLAPVVAAILMPLSSISIILFTNGLSWLSASKLLKDAATEQRS